MAIIDKKCPRAPLCCRIKKLCHHRPHKMPMLKELFIWCHINIDSVKIYLFGRFMGIDQRRDSYKRKAYSYQENNRPYPYIEVLNRIQSIGRNIVAPT